MQGQKQFTDKVVVRFRLPERVPRHNLCHRLDEAFDLRFLYEETQALYPSIALLDSPRWTPSSFSSPCWWTVRKHQ